MIMLNDQLQSHLIGDQLFQSDDEVDDNANGSSTSQLCVSESTDGEGRRHADENEKTKTESIEEESKVDSLPKNQNNKLVHEQRRQVQQALASIHAPPLSTNIYKIARDSSRKNYFQLLVQLAETHVHLLQTIEKSIDVIRMASSIQLGLGPSSPAVERVEESMKFSTKSGKSQSIIRSSGKLSVQKMRLALFRVMEMQHKNLTTILGIIESETNENNGEESKDNDGNDIYDIAKETNLLTLSILNSCKRRTGDLLSKVLSSGFDNDSCIHGRGERHKHVLNCIQSSIYHVDEQQAYLSTCFSSLTASMENDEAVKGKKSTEIFKHLYHYGQHIDASNVMLWRLTHSFQERCNVSEDGSQAEVESDLELDLIWDKLTESLQNMFLYRESLERRLFPNRMKASRDSDEDVIANNSNEDEKKCREVDMIEYDDKGKGTRLTSKEKDDPRWEGKTIVFSGNGSKVPKTLKTRQSKDASNPIDMIQMNSFHETTGRVALIKELQSRIDSIEFAEELEVAVLQDNNRSLNDKKDGDKKIPVSKDFFLGVSGDILSELKNAIAEPSVNNE